VIAAGVATRYAARGVAGGRRNRQISATRSKRRRPGTTTSSIEALWCGNAVTLF